MQLFKAIKIAALLAPLVHAQIIPRPRNVTFDGPAYTNAPPAGLLSDGGIPVGNAAALNFDPGFTVINIQKGLRIVTPDTAPNVAVVSGETNARLGSIRRQNGFPLWSLDSFYFRCARKILTIYFPVKCSLLLTYGLNTRLIEGKDGLGISLQRVEPELEGLSILGFAVTSVEGLDIGNVTLILDTIEVRA